MVWVIVDIDFFFFRMFLFIICRQVSAPVNEISPRNIASLAARIPYYYYYRFRHKLPVEGIAVQGSPSQDAHERSYLIGKLFWQENAA